MKIVITGATGFIGSHIKDKLLQEGHSVSVLVRKNSKTKDLDSEKLNVFEVDYSDKNTLTKALENCEIIIHCAGALFGKNYDALRKANVESTINLVDSVKNNSNFKQFIFISSLTAAGPSTSIDMPKSESDFNSPITNYGKSKAEAEDYIENQKDWLNYTILRLPAVYGPRDTAIFSLFKLAKVGFGSLIGFSTKYISLIHSTDVVNGVSLVLNNEICFNKKYFLSSDEYYSWQEVMSVMKKAFNKKLFINLRLPHFLVYIIAYINSFASKILGLTPIFDLDKARDFTQKYWICNNKALKNDVSFTQSVSLEKGILETANWYKEQKWL